MTIQITAPCPSNHKTLTQCCFNDGSAVADGGPTLKRNWLKTSCLLGPDIVFIHPDCEGAIHENSHRGYMSANMKHSPNVGLMSGQHRRRWPDIKTTLGQSHIFVMIMLDQC